MNNSYPYVKLKELCDVNQGLQISIDERFTENAPNRYFYITVQFLKTSHINKFYVENPPSSSICNEDDILIVRTGSTGQIVTGVSGCFHNNFFKVNFNKELIHGRYLYHCLNTKEKYRDMLRRAGVTTIPDLNHFMFLDMEIPFPQKKNQIEIAKTLDSLDSKIELNNRINAELEAMAKTLYDYWFVQFDFPDKNGKPYKTSGGKMGWNEELKREIPQGWEVLRLSTKFTFEKGIEPGSAEYVEHKESIHHVKFIRVGDVDGSSAIFIDTRLKTYAIVYKKDVLVTFDGSVGKVAFGLEGAYSGGLRRIYDKSRLIDSSLIYFIFKDERINKTIHKYATGSILLHAGSSIDVLKIPYSEKIYLEYQSSIKASYHKMVINKTENEKLTELRDWLLPMLMNGQVKVKDEKETELSMAAEPQENYKTTKK